MEKCPKCNEQLEDKFSFCPYCDEPLNDLAKKLQSEKEKTAQLSLLYALIKKTDDPKLLTKYKELIETVNAK